MMSSLSTRISDVEDDCYGKKYRVSNLIMNQVDNTNSNDKGIKHGSARCTSANHSLTVFTSNTENQIANQTSLRNANIKNKYPPSGIYKYVKPTTPRMNNNTGVFSPRGIGSNSKQFINLSTISKETKLQQTPKHDNSNPSQILQNTHNAPIINAYEIKTRIRSQRATTASIYIYI